MSSTNELAWRGIHHIAVATADLDATVIFYNEVMGMPVSDIFPSRNGRGRHCLIFAKPGDSETWGLHFFERPPAEGQTISGGAMLHIAFTLPDAETVNTLHQRLLAHHIQPQVLHELGGNLLFSDNNGIMLEVTWPH